VVLIVSGISNGRKKTIIRRIFSVVPIMGGISFQKNSKEYPLGNESTKRMFHRKIGIIRIKQFKAYVRIFLLIIFFLLDSDWVFYLSHFVLP
jgi:hypothetical protein